MYRLVRTIKNYLIQNINSIEFEKYEVGIIVKFKEVKHEQSSIIYMNPLYLLSKRRNDATILILKMLHFSDDLREGVRLKHTIVQ